VAPRDADTRDQARRAAARAALAAAGVDPEETAAAALIAVAGRSPELDAALVERLAAAPSAENAAALRALATGAEERGWKAPAKEARRALYRFAQRGIAVPAPPAPAPTPRRPVPSSLAGYLSPIDGRGDRLVWLARPGREGGLAVMTAIVNEPAGLREVALAELTRKQLRRMEEDLRARHGLRMVPVDGAYCDALLSEAFTRARAAGTPGVGEYPAYRTRLVTGEPAALEPSLYARTVTTEPDADALARGAALFAEPEFATWIFERATLAPYLEEVAAARQSSLILSRPLQEERIAGALARAVRELFTGAAGAAYRRCLEEMAYYLHATGRPAPAASAAATARALAASTRGGEGIPFLEELTRRSLGALLGEDEARAQAAAEGSVLVRPGAPAPRRPPR
jgi:hypothetical protein